MLHKPLTARRELLKLSLTAMAAGTSLSAFATKTSPYTQDIQRILDSKRLVVGMGKFESPPFFSSSPEGPKGLDVDFARRLAGALGVELVIRREAETFNDVVEALDRNEIDIAISKISITYPRALRFKFSDPYLLLRHGLAFNRIELAKFLNGRDLANELRDWTGDIGVIEKSSFAGFARSRFPKAKVREMPSWPDLVNAVIKGDVLCAYRDELEIKRLARVRPESSLVLRTATLTDTRDALGMVFNRDAAQLQQVANLFIANQPAKLSVDGILETYKSNLKI
jgi:polar amino acid transport system substrate-binding protein